MKKEIKKEYYYNGKLMCEIPYVNGKRHGIAKWYYMHGKLGEEIPYVNGLIHGCKKEYVYEDTQ